MDEHRPDPPKIAAEHPWLSQVLPRIQEILKACTPEAADEETWRKFYVEVKPGPGAIQAADSLFERVTGDRSREHRRPYTLADLAATPDDERRHELISGAMIASWSRYPLHDRVVEQLRITLGAAAPKALQAESGVPVQCGPDTVLVPDVVVLPSSRLDDSKRPVQAEDVVLVAEVVWDTTAMMDRVLRPVVYGSAGIETMLLVGLDGPEAPDVLWLGLPEPEQATGRSQG